MEQRTLHAPVNALIDVDRSVGVEIAALTRYSIPVLIVLTPDAHDDSTTAEALLEASEEFRLTFDGVFSPTTEDSFVGVWDGGTLVGAILAVRESPWDDAPDGPFVADLVIDPEYRHRGIAMALIVEVVSRCKGWDFDPLALWIGDRHLGAAEPYDDLRFEEID